MLTTIIKICTMLAFVCAGVSSYTCPLNESRALGMKDIPIKNITNTTFLPTFEFKTCDVCTPVHTHVTQYSFRQLPEFTFSFGTDNPDTALLNQYRP
jgi:hypothetical protein